MLNSSSKLISLIFFCGAFSIFSACTKDIPQETHEGEPISVERIDFLEDSEKVKIFKQKLSSEILPLIEKGESLENGTEEFMQEVIRPLSNKLLSNDFFEDGFFNIRVSRHIFTKFNEFLLRALDSPLSRKAALEVIDKYHKLIFFSCTEDFNGCSYLPFFKDISKSKNILLTPIHYAKGDSCKLYKDIRQYYRVLNIAYSFEAEGVGFYYFACAAKYLERLNLEYDSAASPETLKQIDDLLLKLSNILLLSHTADSKPLSKDMATNYLAIIRDLHGLLKENKVNYKRDDIKSLKDQLFYFLIANDGIDKSKLKIDEMRYILDDSSSKFLYKNMIDYFKIKHSKILYHMDVDVLDDNIMLKIIDLVANKQLDNGLAGKIYKLYQDRDGLKKVAENFLKVMLLRQVLESNLLLASLFKDKEINTQDFIEELLLIEEKINLTVKKTYEVMDRLRTFLIPILDKAEVEEIGFSYQKFVHAINYLLSNPHTMLITYKLEEMNFNAAINYKQKNRGRYNFKSNKAYYNLFFATPQSADSVYILNYLSSLNSDVEQFPAYQKLYSLNFLMKLDTSSTLGIPLEVFLKKLFSGMLNAYQELVTHSHEDILYFERENKDKRKKINLICDEERKRKESEKKGKIYNPKYTIELNVTKLMDGVLSEIELFQEEFLLPLERVKNNDQLLLLEESNYAYTVPFVNEQLRRLEYLRLGDKRLMRYLDLITEIYREFRLKTGSSLSALEKEAVFRDIKKQISILREPIEKYNHEKRKYYTSLKERNKSLLEACNNLLLSRVLQLHNSVYWKEIEYLRGVYRDKSQLMELPWEEREDFYKSHIEPKYRFTDLGKAYNDYKGGDAIIDDFYVYNSADAMLRIKGYLEELAPEIKITEPGTLYDYFTSSLNPSTKDTISFLDRQGNFISEDEFIRQSSKFFQESSLSNHNGRLMSLDILSSQYAKNFLPYLVLLYKLGEVELYSYDKECLESDAYKPDICSIQRENFIDAQRLIDLNLDLSNMFSISQKEEELFDFLGIQERYNAATGMPYLLGYLMDPNYTKMLPFLDYAYILLTRNPFFHKFPINPWETEASFILYGQDRLSVESLNRVENRIKSIWQETIWSEMKAYRESLENLKYLVFPIKEGMKEYLIPKFREAFKAELDREKDFLAAVKEESEKKEKVFIAFDFELNKPIYEERSHRSSLSKKRIYGPYLDYELVEKYKEIIEEFNQETEFLFEP